MRLKIKLVRIGPESSIHKDILNYSLPKLAEKHLPLKLQDHPEIKVNLNQNIFFITPKLCLGRERTQRKLDRSGQKCTGQPIPKRIEAMRKIDYRKKQHYLYHFEQLYQCSAYRCGQHVSDCGFFVFFFLF